jgi:LDH2 family malate/lactate/ureidoglycolate dehydrogenase
MSRFTISQLQHFAISIFEHIGCNSNDAETAADVLISADLRGIDSHGVSRLKGYVGLYEAGRINTKAKPKISRENKSTFNIDGDGGLGLVVAPFAMKETLKRAETYGSGWCAIQNSNHYGIAGEHAMQASKRDMIGVSMTNATPFVPPTFSKQAMLGTNPMAWAFPTGKPFDLVVDLATAAVARGKLEIAKREGKDIPKGWVVDKDGLPSTDIDVLEKGGLLSPLGSLEELGSHKGYALSALVDILTAVLSGANYGPWVPPFVPFLPLLPDLPGKGLGHFLGAMEIDGFRPKDEFISHIDNWIDTFKSSERVEDNQEVFVPGEIEYNIEQERKTNGIPLNTQVIQDLETLGKKFKVKL